MSLGENSLVAAYQGRGQLKSRPSGTRVVTGGKCIIASEVGRPCFAHWIQLSLISMQWFCCIGGNENAVHSLFSAGERVSHYFFNFPLSFNTNYDNITIFKTKRKSCNNFSKSFVIRSSCRVSPLSLCVTLLFFND